MSTSYGIPPPTATLDLKPFTISLKEEGLTHLKVLLEHSRLPVNTFENTREDNRFGLTKTWIQEAKTYWETQFDWYLPTHLALTSNLTDQYS